MTFAEGGIAALGFVAGVVTTAVTREVVRRFIERPQPFIRISDITISPTGASKDSPIEIDYLLRVAEQRIPILPVLDDELTIDKCLAYIVQSKVMLNAHDAVMAHLAEMRDSPNLLDPAKSEEEKRVDIIKQWTKFGSATEKLEHLAVAHFFQEIPDRYKEAHPDAWKSGDDTYVTLGPNTRFQLGEIDSEAEARRAGQEKGPDEARRVRESCERTNIGRRFWIHLQQDDLRWLISKTYVIAESIKQDAQRLLGDLQAIIDSNTPEYVRVQLLVTNKGNRPIAIKPFAYLTIPDADPAADSPAVVPLIPEGTSHSAPVSVLVPGNDAAHITLISEEPLAILRVCDSSGNVILTGDRLRSIYEGQIVECRVGVLLTGFGIVGNTAITSEPYKFGIKANILMRKEMANALTE